MDPGNTGRLGTLSHSPTSRLPSPPRLLTYLALNLMRMLGPVGALWDCGCLACWILPRLMAAS